VVHPVLAARGLDIDSFTGRRAERADDVVDLIDDPLFQAGSPIVWLSRHATLPGC
jgi:hypothetical protein